MLGSGDVDPFRFYEYAAGSSNGFGDAKDRTAVAGGVLNTKIVITGGQSNMATACGGAHYSVANTEAVNLSIYDGGIYRSADPMLGCASTDSAANIRSSVNARIADRILANGKASRVIMVPVAVGGSLFAEWEPTATRSLFTRIQAAILRVRAQGYEPDKIAWGQGEADATAGTSAAAIKASIWAIVDGIRALSCTAPFYIGKYTTNGGVVNATVQTAIANSIDAGRIIRAGFDCDTNCPDPAQRLDGTHLNDTGLTTSGQGWGDVLFP